MGLLDILLGQFLPAFCMSQPAIYPLVVTVIAHACSQVLDLPKEVAMVTWSVHRLLGA